MRIIFSDWVIALDKGRLPRQYDDGEPLEVVNAPDGWAWTLNTQLDGNLDVIPLTATNGVVGTTLSKSQLALAGDYWLQLIGTKDGVTRHTNIIGMAVPASLSGDANWPTLPTAFSDALDRAEDAADRAESAATHGPRISGTNTWEVWDPDKGQYVDTMVDASGKTGPQGPAGVPGKDGAGMDITGARVGQIAKITAVDTDGKPTKWEPVDMPSGGGVSNTFEKVVEMTTLEDAAVISISTDKNGNPLSMSEFYVAITTARNNAATANNIFSCNVFPDTVPIYVRARSAIKNLMLYQDVYCYVVHYKVVGRMIFNEYSSKARTASGLNVAEYLENEKTIGINAGSGGTIGFLSSPDASTGESKIDSSGKMYCITFDADNAECIFGAGTRVEVWAR